MPQLANYMGTGDNPRIYLELSPNNGSKWRPFIIDYQETGNIPWSTDSAHNWSPWDVKDQNKNYYGTITLSSDGKNVWWNGYSTGIEGFYLEGINFSYNNKLSAHQLTVEKIHTVNTKGPFPNAPLATPAIYSGTSTPIVFNVNGSKIINNRGEAVLLKGIVRPSLEWNSQGEFFSIQDLQNIRSWGSNVIRLDLNQNFWLKSAPVNQSGSYKQIINAIVYYSIQMNMAIILDLHWTEDGHQSPMANQSSLQFWQEVAHEYKDFGTVLFELFNEPEGIDQSTWLNGNNLYSGYQQLYNAVRITGANNICIVNGLDYGYDLNFVNDSFKVNGFNIVYGSHPYNGKGTVDWAGLGGSFDNNFKGVLDKYPLIFTEFGVNDQPQYFPTGYIALYDWILGYANQHLINYTGFAWWVEADLSKANVFPCLIKDWMGTPLNGGVQIKQDIQHHPGTSIK